MTILSASRHGSGGGEARGGDVCAGCGRRARGHEEQRGQPDVPEDEPDEASGERHEEAPDTDPQQRQPVHSLEYPG